MEFKLFQPLYIHEMGKRTNQEDSLYPNDGQATVDNRIFIVCDGMGGHDKGEVASAAVCQGLSQRAEALLSSERPFTDDDFKAALAEAFDTLDRADTEHAGKMGTTMTFICLHRGGVLAAHIGDSRIYHFRPQTGEVLYRSRDHSLVQQLYEMGDISYNEMGTNPRKNVIMRAMQPYQDERVEATFLHTTDVRPGDYFYLCSDGMLEQMEDDEMLSIIGNPALTEEQKVEEFIRRTADNSDNHTAYLVKVQEVVNEAGDEAYPNDEPEARRRNKALNDLRKDVVWDYKPDGTPGPAKVILSDDDDEATQIVPPPASPATAAAATAAAAQEAAPEVETLRTENNIRPQAMKAEPQAATTRPQAATTRPQAATNRPQAATTRPQAATSNRRNLLILLALLGVIAIGVVLWLILKSPATDEGLDVEDDPLTEEQMNPLDQVKDNGFISDEGMEDILAPDPDLKPQPDDDRTDNPDAGNAGGASAGETPTTDNPRTIGEVLQDSYDEHHKNYINEKNK